MDNWVLVSSFARPKSLWAIRVTHIMKAVGKLGLELITCETAPIEPIMQNFLDSKVGPKVFMYEL